MRRTPNFVKSFSKVPLIEAIALFIYMWTVRLTSRTRFENDADFVKDLKDEKPIICVFFHSRILMTPLSMTRKYKIKNLFALVSKNRSAVTIARICKWVGAKIIYGSSDKNIVGEKSFTSLRQSIRVLKDKGVLFIAGDGPVGPPFELKEGAFYLAKKTNSVVYPIVISANNKLTLKKTWDKTVLILPFSKIRFKFLDKIDFSNVDKKKTISEIAKETSRKMKIEQDKID